jgi:phosphinothricin acetyltransferase
MATIRLAAPADGDALASIYAPVVSDTHISFETTPPTADEMATRVRETTERHPWVVCEHDGRVVGYAYATSHKDRPAYRWSVDTSVYVDESWRRRGVARGCYESLFALLERLGYGNAYAVVALPNEASVGFHEALGFERVGVYRRVGYKGGAWRDVGHWERSLQRLGPEPSPPTPVPEAEGTAGFEAALAAGESSLRLD